MSNDLEPEKLSFTSYRVVEEIQLKLYSMAEDLLTKDIYLGLKLNLSLMLKDFADTFSFRYTKYED